MIEIRHETAARRAPIVFVDLPLDTPGELARLLGTAIAAGDVALVVDLGDRADASSDVLTLLHRTGRHLRRLGGSLAVVARHPAARRLFELTLISRTVPVFATREEALRGWS